ncbi:hypothetical protein [Vallitalea okinawensis]|uniref:hypothetical protein n=1 Tax=Vallitalea okinawensis TaxID=2078660 RepID=UPI000CFDF954|nr:hypothetical protein [Vallitalea okinawensis]
MSKDLDRSKMNAVQELLGGQREDDTRDLEIIQQHGIKITKKQIVAIQSLKMLNQYFQVEEVNGFIDKWLELSKYSPDSAKDILKGIEYKNNKKLIEKTNIGMKVSN